MLAEEGTTILKFFLHISKEEQRKQLQERVDDPTKWWKFNLGDLAERARWDDYMAAYSEAISTTSTSWAPWYVVPTNHRWYRDYLLSSIVVETLDGLKMSYPEPAEDLTGVVVE
jgi:polyphosphate kinase 2 (PPK2 family)